LDAPIILNAPKSIYENDKVAVENNTNRFLPYSRSYPSPSTSTSTQSHTKYGFYKPMQWTKEVIHINILISIIFIILFCRLY